MDYNTVINGLSNEEINKRLEDYSKYLQGIIEDKYEASQGLVKLLKLDGSNDQQKLTSVISTIKSYESTDDITSLDLTQDNLLDDDDINLLDRMINTRESAEGLTVTGEREFTTVGGYRISFDETSTAISIYNSAGNMITEIWGDPHVSEYDDNGQLQDDADLTDSHWHYGDDSTFILDDGTKLVLNSEQVGEKTSLFFNKGIYITDGDKVFHYGNEFGEGRNNSNISGQEEGDVIHSIRELDVDAKEWDAAVADKNSSNRRNGVFVFDEITNQWALLQEDGSLEDVANEGWYTSYWERVGDELFTNANQKVSITREQKIALLDGQSVLDFSELSALDFNIFQTEVEDEYLYGSLNTDFLYNAAISAELVQDAFDYIASLSQAEQQEQLNAFFEDPNQYLFYGSAYTNFYNLTGINLENENFYGDPEKNQAFKDILVFSYLGLDYSAALEQFPEEEAREFVESYAQTASEFLHQYDQLASNASETVVSVLDVYKNALYDGSSYINETNNNGSNRSRTRSRGSRGTTTPVINEQVYSSELQEQVNDVLNGFLDDGLENSESIHNAVNVLVSSLADEDFDDSKSLSYSITEDKIASLNAKKLELIARLEASSGSSSSRSRSRSGGVSLEQQIANIDAQIAEAEAILAQLA